MEKVLSVNTKITKLILLLVLKAIVSCLIITSLVVEDWVKGSDWAGSLFFCTEGEYKGQQYFSIYCSSSECVFKKLGKAGAVYLITSVLSLLINLTWAGFAIHQFKLGYSHGSCIKILLSFGSAGIYSLGTLTWASVTGFFSIDSKEKQLGIGPKIAAFCILIYAFAAIFYILTDRNPDKELLPSIDENRDENTPTMKSVKVEGRFVYPNSVEIEGQGENEETI